MRLTSVTPILRIFDVEKAKDFYLGFLGFSLAWEHRFEPEAPLYCCVRRDDCSLHLSEHHGDACPGAHVRIAAAALEALAEEITGREYRYNRPELTEKPWGGHELDVVDPFGNRLTFFAADGRSY